MLSCWKNLLQPQRFLFFFFLLGPSVNRRKKFTEKVNKKPTGGRLGKAKNADQTVLEIKCLIGWSITGLATKSLEEKVLFIKLTESCYDVRKILSEVFQLLDCHAWFPELVLAVFQKNKLICYK